MHRRATTSEYDLRFDRAQTVDGAKARYVAIASYTLADLERDVGRILRRGEYPDRTPRPDFEGQEARRG